METNRINQQYIRTRKTKLNEKYRLNKVNIKERLFDKYNVKFKQKRKNRISSSICTFQDGNKNLFVNINPMKSHKYYECNIFDRIFG